MLQNKKNNRIAIALLSLVLSPYTAYADKQKMSPTIPYYFIADSVLYSSKAHTITYTGHVKVDQGQTHITGDQLILELTRENKITKMIDTGQPATYTTVLKDHPGMLHARAQKITYEQTQQIVYLDGNAFVDQNHNTIRAEHIRYEKQNGVIHTYGSAQNKATYIVVQPNATQPKAKHITTKLNI